MFLPASVLLNRLMAKARFRHLQVLVRLAELGSVQRTAQSVGMTQPAVTHILADLESLLDVPLFQRHARGVRPTPTCNDLLPLIRQILAGLEASAEAVSHRQQQGQGVVRLVASGATVNGLLAPAIAAFNAAHPDIQVHLREAEITDALGFLAAGEVDLVGCRRPAITPAGWEFHPLREDEFVVLCGPSHPLAGKRRVSWKALAAETWLPAPVGTAARARLDELAIRWGTPLRTCEVITRVPIVTARLLQTQRLLTLVPVSSLRPLIDDGQLAVVHLPEPLPFDPLGMLLPSQSVGAATQKLADFLTRHAKPPKARP